MARFSLVFGLVVVFVHAREARAGVHNLAEIHPPLAVEEARGYLLRVRSASVPLPDPPRPESFKAQVLRQIADLEERKRKGLFTTNDRINLSACYLRLGGDRVSDAIRLLLAGDDQHFLIQSNLAAAYFLSGELTMAQRHQQIALTRWPEVFAGWNDAQLRRNRECERLLLSLYQSRAEESRRGPVRGPVDTDPLFPGLRYEGPEGTYQPGQLAQGMWDRLPANAFNLLYQLNIWFPTDMRLYWQLGEMLNALGAIDQASDIFVELVQTGLGGSFRGLHGHRRTLVDALPLYREWARPGSRGKMVSTVQMMTTPALPIPPFAGAMAVQQASTLAPAIWLPTVGQDLPPSLAGLPGQPSASTDPVFNFRHIGVSFGFGFLTAALIAFQIIEWKRRVGRKASPEEP